MMRSVALLYVLLASRSLFAQTATIHSPNRQLALTFSLSQGAPRYALKLKQRDILHPSSLGIRFADSDLAGNLTVIGMDSTVVDETWTPVWGETKTIRNHYRQLVVHLQQSKANPINYDVIFRVFDDGLGFRYSFPAQPNLQHAIVVGESSGFQLVGDHKAFWIPGDFDSNEYPYNTTPLSKINAGPAYRKQTDIAVRYVTDTFSVATPLMMKTSDGVYINIHEAALANYPAMQLHIDTKSFNLSSSLVTDAVGNMAYVQAPFVTPWRTVVVSESAAGILSSRIILNLNEPCAIADPSWIKPQKMVGVWWEMHVGKASWDYANAAEVGNPPDWKQIKPHGHHGATTANTKRYIDFAAAHGFSGVLVEGWNIGWEDWFGKWKEDVFDFVTPYPDFDVDELRKYAASKKVKLIMHHETSGSVTNYERRMEEAYRFMKTNGYDAVKTGYVGRIIPRGEHHDGQWMINHYNRVAATTAEYQIMVDMHESVRPTGMHRTYPNWLACEAARGNEFNAWSGGSPPEHETILPFTRLMGGPMDYTPGIFQIRMEKYGRKGGPKTTLAKQLALYVTLYSPLQMVSDLPENYEAHLDAFQFIKDVAVDWDDTRVIEAEPGDYLTIARKEKGKDNWFVGAITDENKRSSTVPLAFLDVNKTYLASIYKDAPTSHWERNAMEYQVARFAVTSKTVLKTAMVEGGGYAVSLVPATDSMLKGVKKYK